MYPYHPQFNTPFREICHLSSCNDHLAQGLDTFSAVDWREADWSKLLFKICSPTQPKSTTATTTGLRQGPYGYAPPPEMLRVSLPPPMTLHSEIKQKPQITIGQKLSAKRLTEHDAQTYLTLDTRTTVDTIVSALHCQCNLDEPT